MQTSYIGYHRILRNYKWQVKNESPRRKSKNTHRPVSQEIKNQAQTDIQKNKPSYFRNAVTQHQEVYDIVKYLLIPIPSLNTLETFHAGMQCVDRHVGSSRNFPGLGSVAYKNMSSFIARNNIIRRDE